MTAQRPLLAAALVVLAAATVLAVEAAPDLSVSEAFFAETWGFQGEIVSPVTLEVPHGQPLTFSWVADASAYGGTILGYRAGWDVVDVADENDPGWIQAGYDPALLSAPPRDFTEGIHGFTVKVMDTEQGLSIAFFILEIQPEVPTETSTWSAVKALYGD